MSATPWSDRVAEVLADPEAAAKAALLYYLVAAHVHGPIERRRRDTLDLLWDEVDIYAGYVRKEAGVPK